MIPKTQVRFLVLVTEILTGRNVTVTVLQILVGKCVSFSLAILAAILFTREMNTAISMAQRTEDGDIDSFTWSITGGDCSLVFFGYLATLWREERQICVFIALLLSSLLLPLFPKVLLSLPRTLYPPMGCSTRMVPSVVASLCLTTCFIFLVISVSLLVSFSFLRVHLLLPSITPPGRITVTDST